MYKYVKNISNSGEATILLYGEIGKDIIGNDFATEMLQLQNEATLINIRINSVGGSVLDGYSIISSILDSSVPVNTYTDGLSASIAGVIALCGNKHFMKDFATLLIHDPWGGDDQKMLDKIKDSLVTILSNRSNLTTEQVSNLMSKETIFNAKEAMTCGLIDAIEPTNKKIRIKRTNANLQEMALIYNKIITQDEMKEIKNQLGLDSGVEENEVVESIKTLQEKVEALTKNLEEANDKNTELANKVDEYENEKVETKRKEIEEMVNTYINTGKIQPEQKDATIKMASFDFEATKNMLELIGAKSMPKILDSITQTETTLLGERAGWSIRDWEKKDPNGLMRLKNESPAVFGRMYDAFYKPKK